MAKNKVVEGIIAEFENPAELIKAAEKMRDSDYKKFDCHSPFPIHGMDRAMGEKRSPLGWIVGTVAFLGLGAGFALQWWTSAVAYPLVIAGKPFFSYQAYGPVAFAVMVLSSAFVSLIGMLILNKLPRFNHPVFNSERFSQVSNDAFMVSIEAEDAHFDKEKTRQFLESIGGKNIEYLESDEEQSKD
jgi:hypothetical protein